MGTITYPPELEFAYLPCLAFQSRREKQKVLGLAMEEYRKGNVPAAALEMGKKHRKKIGADYAPNVSICYVNDRVGYGVFAEQKLKANRFVGEYVGIVRENIRIYFAPLNNYCYEYPIPDAIGRNYVIDGSQGNFTRFINHSAKPNLKPHYAFLDGLYHLILLTIRDIEKGEQLSYEYGPSYWYLRSPPEEI